MSLMPSPRPTASAGSWREVTEWRSCVRATHRESAALLVVRDGEMVRRAGAMARLLRHAYSTATSKC